jgi:hypothetical protein
MKTWQARQAGTLKPIHAYGTLNRLGCGGAFIIARRI